MSCHAAGDATVVGSHKVQGEETWAFLRAEEDGKDECLYLRNDISGTVIELTCGEHAGSFVYRDSPWGSPAMCWLRDLSRCVAKAFVSQDTIDMLELGEGERFPRTVADQVQGRAPYIDKALGGLKGWQLTGQRGHVVLQGVWGVEVWLIADGFIVLSSLSPRALFVRQGVSCYSSAEDAWNFMAMDRLFTWLESHCGEAIAQAHTSDATVQLERERQVRIEEHDDDVARLRLWLPPLPDPTKQKPPSKPQTPSNSELGWLQADWEPSSRPQTRYTDGTYSSRPVTRGSGINRWSAPSGRAIAEDMDANLATLERLAQDGIISIEQLEACKAAAYAADPHSLEENLQKFQGSHHLEHQINWFYSKVESMRKELATMEFLWGSEVKALHAGYDDALLTLVRKIRLVEEELAKLPPQLVQPHQKSDDDESEGDEESDDLPPEQLAVEKDRNHLNGMLAHLQQSVENTEEQHTLEAERVTKRQFFERKAMERQIQNFRDKIVATKEMFREVKAIEEKRRLDGTFRSGDGQKRKNMSKLLQRPRVIRENRSMLTKSLPNTYPFENPMTDEEFRHRYGELRGDEVATVLSQTVVHVANDAGLNTSDTSFVVGEFTEIVGFTRPKVHVFDKEYDDFGDTYGATSRCATGKTGKSMSTSRGASRGSSTAMSQRNANTRQSTAKSRYDRSQERSLHTAQDPFQEELLLKKKLAVLQNVAITKSTRLATKPRSDQREVLEYMINEQDKDTVFREKEVRAVFSIQGTDYLTEMPAPLDWTAHVPLGHEREVSRKARDDKHELQRFAEGLALQAFERSKERRAANRNRQRDSAGETQQGDDEDEEPSTISQVVEHLKKQHQGSWIWASKHMRKARAAREHRYTMSVSKGQAPELRYKEPEDEEGFDYEAAARNTTVMVKQAIPTLSAVWTTSWDLTEELWEGLARLDSPKRRGLWTLISEADGVLPGKMRARAASILVYAYRCYLAKLKAQHFRLAYHMRMYVRLQCNIRMAISRRALPKRRIEMASVFEERERLYQEKLHLERVTKLKINETSQLSEDDKVFWMTHQPVSVQESLARRLLGLCDGDVARAMGLAGYAGQVTEESELRPPTVVQSNYSSPTSTAQRR